MLRLEVILLPWVVLPYKAGTPVVASSRLLLALWEHPHGLETTAEATHRLDNAADPNCLARRILAQCIYDIGKNTAYFGSAKIDGPALMWTLIDGTPLGGKTLNRTPSDRKKLDGTPPDRTPPDERALNRTPPAGSADSVKPRGKPAGSTAGAYQANPQADLASAISLDTRTDPARNHSFESPALASTVSLDTADNWVSSMRPPGISPALVSAISLNSTDSWVMRCDRVDFSPAAVAHPHTHPGPGIRRLLFGELAVTTAGATSTYRRGGAWFESGPDVVYAEASPTEETAFVRVMLLPSEWAGKRTISYVDTAGTTASTKGRQRATILGEELLDPLAKA